MSIRCNRRWLISVHGQWADMMDDQSLQYGGKSCRLNATPSRSDIQFFNTSVVEDANSLAFAGRMSHILAMQKAEEDIAGADEALMKLQNSLASAKQAKESNR